MFGDVVSQPGPGPNNHGLDAFRFAFAAAVPSPRTPSEPFPPERAQRLRHARRHTTNKLAQNTNERPRVLTTRLYTLYAVIICAPTF